MTDDVLRRAAALSAKWLRTLRDRPVGAAGDPAGLRVPLAEAGEDPVAVIEALAAGAEPGLVASPGPRYFGFVTGGSLPAALAADWLTSAWDQNACLHVMSPAAATAEQTVARWVCELLGLPADAGVGLVTGAQMANVTALAAARGAVLARSGWDVEERGLIGAPPIPLITSAESHATVFNALRLLGLGRDTAVRVPTDEQGRMRADELAPVLAAADSPAIVCAQAGNVDTGAFDPFQEIVRACRDAGAWCHVDGAFGLWAAAAPGRAHLTAGVAGADSWAVDAHKWLNVPYESALAIVADPAPLNAAMALTAAYLTTAGERERCGSSGAAAWPSWSSATARSRRGSRRGSRPSRGSRFSTRWCSTRRCCGSAATTPPPPPWSRSSRRRARAGSAARSGRAARRCACRCRAGARPRRTPTAPPTRSPRRGGRSRPADAGVAAAPIRIGSAACGSRESGRWSAAAHPASAPLPRGGCTGRARSSRSRTSTPGAAAGLRPSSPSGRLSSTATSRARPRSTRP